MNKVSRIAGSHDPARRDAFSALARLMASTPPMRRAISASMARLSSVAASVVLARAGTVLAQPGKAVAPSRDFPALPAVTQLEYAVFLDDYRSGSRVATMNQKFELLPDGEYRFHSEAQATGLLALIWRGTMLQFSTGRIDARGLHPTRFEDQRGNRKRRGATIDPVSRQVTFADGRQVAAPSGIQDRLSVVLQLGLLLAAGAGDGAPLPAGHVFEFPMLATSRVIPSQWRVEDSEDLSLGSDTIRATPVRRLPLPGEDPSGGDPSGGGSSGDPSPSIEVWFDPARLPWPVRVRIAEPGGQALDEVLQRAD